MSSNVSIRNLLVLTLYAFFGVPAFAIFLSLTLRPSTDVVPPGYAAYSIDPRPLLDQIPLHDEEPLDRLIAAQATVLRRAPFSVGALTAIGERLTERYDFDHALVFLTVAQAIAPEETRVLIALGKLHFARRDFNEAVNMFLRAAKRDPANATVLTYAGRLRLLFKRSGAKEALRFFSLALATEPSHEAAYRESKRIAALTNGLPTVESELLIAIARAPTDLLPRLALGDAYMACGYAEAAAIAFAHAIEVEPRSTSAHMGLAQSYAAIGRDGDAEAEFMRTTETNPYDVDGIHLAAQSKLAHGENESALVLTRLLIARRPSYPGAYSLLAKLEAARGDLRMAVSAMSIETEKHPDDQRARIDLARMLIRAGRFVEARNELAIIEALPDPTTAPEFVYVKIEADYLTALCHRAEGNWKEAEDVARRGLAIDGGNEGLRAQYLRARKHVAYSAGRPEYEGALAANRGRGLFDSARTHLVAAGRRLASH